MKQAATNEPVQQNKSIEEDIKSGASIAQAKFIDNRSQAVAQMRLNAMASEAMPAIVQRKEETSIQGGLPSQLRQGVEALSGMSMEHVKVHYNSPQPAQLNAHAYAQGSEIHVAPGQERHLPHEAWHVVQQAQGRVQPTVQMKETVSVNDDAGLEHEADVMGSRALAMGGTAQRMENGATNTGNSNVSSSSAVKQLRNNTEIVYQEGTLNWQATNAGHFIPRNISVGINTTALIDPEDPENGERTGAPPANNIYTSPPAGHFAAQNGGANLTQGHLLNANLGGKAQSYNLFPITAEMNRAHSHLVEDNVKALVLDINAKRLTEGSHGAGAVAAAGLATARGRAVDQVNAPIAEAGGRVAATAASVAMGGQITAAYGGIAPVPAGLIAAITAATGPVAVTAGANESLVAHAAINAAALVAGITPADIAIVAHGVAASFAAAPAWHPVAGVGAAATTAAAAGLVTAAINAAPTAQGIGGTWTARPIDIATAVSTVPLAGLPGGFGAGNWGNSRVFYNVSVTAPGINGAARMRPNTLRQEQFHCIAYQTANDGITRRPGGTYINTVVNAPFTLNADLAALGFAPSAAPIPGLAISAAVGGVVGALNAPSQHDVVDHTGAVVGHATLFKHN